MSAGHRLVATARDPAQLEDLVAHDADRVRAVALDVRDPVAADAAVRTALDAFGRLDVLVNNAGYADLAAVEDGSLEAFRAQLETNLMGVVIVTKAALPVLRAQGAGRIIQISSVGGRMASPGLSAYQAAKWAVGGFSEVLAAEVGPLGVKVTIVEPGGMRTDWAGASMSVLPVSAPYEPTVGARVRQLGDFDQTAEGDPAKVARAVLTVAALEEPPLRLLLGSDAYAYGREAWRARLAEDERWEGLSRSTDRDDATPEQRDPLGRQAGAR